MPLVSTAVSGFMNAKGASLALAGSKFSTMASAISSAVCTYVLSAAIINSTNIVLGPGAGTHTGKVVGLVASSMAQLMVAKAASTGMAGRDISKLFNAVSFGVVQGFNTVMAQGSVIGGGPGTGSGKILGLVPTALSGLIMAQTAVKLLSGKDMAKLASAIAFGACTHIMANGTVTNTCIGAAAGPPAGPVSIPAAPGRGRLV